MEKSKSIKELYGSEMGAYDDLVAAIFANLESSYPAGVVMSFSCPLCHQPLTREKNSYICPQRHQFDMAKEGYVNLLPVQHKRSRDPGDSAEMMQARRAFLDA